VRRPRGARLKLDAVAVKPSALFRSVKRRLTANPASGGGSIADALEAGPSAHGVGRRTNAG
jgi:hypothetical protein